MGVILSSHLVLYGETRIIFIKPIVMLSVDWKILVLLPVYNNSGISCISHKISAMGYIINIISWNMPIDDVEYYTPYFDVFVFWYWSVPEEVREITMKNIFGLVGEPDGILIGWAPKFLLVTWFNYKVYCDISKCRIWDFTFPIEWRCISICILYYDVYVMICPNKFRLSFQCSIFIHSDESKFLIMISQCSNN